jgi:hypothetical protein
MCLTAVVARMGSVRSFFRPFEDRQMRVTAMDHDPSPWVFAFQAAYLTSVNCINHLSPPSNLL